MDFTSPDARGICKYCSRINCEDMEKFRQCHRLDRNSFEEILTLVAQLIEKKDTQLRSSVKPIKRLSVTCFLASGLYLANLYS